MQVSPFRLFHPNVHSKLVTHCEVISQVSSPGNHAADGLDFHSGEGCQDICVAHNAASVQPEVHSVTRLTRNRNKQKPVSCFPQGDSFDVYFFLGKSWLWRRGFRILMGCTQTFQKTCTVSLLLTKNTTIFKPKESKKPWLRPNSCNLLAILDWLPSPLLGSIFRPSATLCRIGLMESHLRRCYGGPPPLAG